MKTCPFSIYQVFGDDSIGFKGNTAAVVELGDEISTEKMQSMAADFNQPATSFIWKNGDKWFIRWFAPDGEIGLCGHGSLAAIGYLIDQKDVKKVTLKYKRGEIQGEFVDVCLCSISLNEILTDRESPPEQALIAGLGVDIKAHYKTENKNLVLVENETVVRSMTPNFEILKECSDFGFIVTAPGENVDFVSRTIVPHVLQLEDPATGSSHAVLTSYWSKRLNKSKLTGHQLSARGGKFLCEISEPRVKLTGSYQVLVAGETFI